MIWQCDFVKQLKPLQIKVKTDIYITFYQSSDLAIYVGNLVNNFIGPQL